MHHDCKRCLLLEAGEDVTYDEIMSYVATIDTTELATDDVIDNRLNKCKSCDYLISGMCRKCGCYVEIRARMKNSSCPNFDDRKW